MTAQTTKTMLPMSIAYDDGTYEWWQVTLPASDDPTVYWYRFIAIDGTDTDYYEDDDARTGGWGQAFDETNDNAYQLTVYDPTFQTPDWIRTPWSIRSSRDRFREWGHSTTINPPAPSSMARKAAPYTALIQEDWN